MAGTLDRSSVGGPSVNITEEPYSFRRSVYGYVDRANMSDLLMQFDMAAPDQPNTKRTSTIVPQQALFLMNSPFMQKQAGSLAAKLPITGSTPDSETIKALYRRTLSRDPKTDELDLAQRFLGEAGSLQNEATIALAAMSLEGLALSRGRKQL